MKAYKRAVSLVVAAIILILAAPVSVFASPVQGNAITSVTISKNKDAINVAATLSDTYVRDNRGKSIYLFELMPEQSEKDLSSLSPIAEAKVSQSLSFSLPFDPNDKARLLSKYVIAAINADGVYTALTDPHYISNPEAVAANTFPFPAAASKKGLEVQLLSDAQMLGISYAVINVSIDSLLLGESTPDSESFIFDGKTYYISRERLDLLDHRVKVLSDSGVIVYLNILLGPPNDQTHEKLKALYYPEALENSTARLCAVNTENAEAVLYYAAILHFLANRYTDPTGEHGFAGGWIIGYEINSNRTYNFMGPKPLADYTDSYAKALRIAYTILRSVYSNGRVYVSVGNNFNAASSELNFAGDELLDYPARLFLERLNQTISISGNFPWNLSINPYPSDPANTAYWNDPNTLQSFDTPYVTMNNIKVICDFMGQEQFLYEGGKRRILVGSFGVSGEAVTSGEALQAAAFAYAYYTVATNDDIEAMIWHRHVDSADESGLRLGLWATAEGESLVPSQTKSIYDVFKYIDTERFGSKEQSLEKTAFALKLIGAASWNDLIPGFDIEKVVTRSVHEDISHLFSDIESKYKPKSLFDFTSGELYGFYASDNAGYIELRTDPSANKYLITDTSATQRNASVLYAKLEPISPFEYMGVSKRFETPVDISKAGYITICVKSEFPEGIPTASIMLRLLGRSAGSDKLAVYEGVSQIKAGEWTEVTFKLTDFASSAPYVDTMNIWVKPGDVTQGFEGEMALSVQSVILHSASSVNILSIVLWAFLIVVAAAVLGFVGLIIRNQIRYRIRLRRQKQRAMLKEQARRMRQQLLAPPNTPRLPPPSQAQTSQVPRLPAQPSQQRQPKTQPPSQQPRRQTGTVSKAGSQTASISRPRMDTASHGGQTGRAAQTLKPAQSQLPPEQQKRRPRPTRRPPI